MLRNIYLITKKELATYFQSWQGYLILSFALLALGVLYEAFPLNTKSNTELLSGELLFRYFYFFSGIATVTSWIIPTRLFAEEQQVGTWTLLASSPLREIEIVLGKYFSALLMIIILCLLSLYIPLDIYIEGQISLEHLFAGYLGVILWSMVCISIGLFFSSITSYQIITFMLTLLVTLFFIFTPMIGNATSGFIKDIFVYSGLYATHYVNFAKGQIHLKDVFYFFSLTILVISATSKIIESRRWK